MLKAHSSCDQVRDTLKPMHPLFEAFQTRDYPVHPTQALIPSAELSPFLARTGREAAAAARGLRGQCRVRGGMWVWLPTPAQASILPPPSQL